MSAMVLQILLSLGVAAVSGTLFSWLYCKTLRARVWQLELDNARLEGQLTREVKTRAAQERWAGQKTDNQLLKDLLALQAANKPQGDQWDREMLRRGGKKDA